MSTKFFLLLLLCCFTSLNLIAQQHAWERTNPGGGGAIALVGATANGTILSASDLSGIYKTTNNGASWEVLGNAQGLTQTNITCFGFHPQDGNTFVIGTGVGAFKTVDGGNTIYPVNMEARPNTGKGFVESMAMDMTTGSTGYMAHHDNWNVPLSFLKTTDFGENWTIQSATGLGVNARIVKIMVDQSDINIVYVLTGKARFGCSLPRLYRSTDGGSNFIPIATGVGDILDVDLHPTNSDIIYVSTFLAGNCSVAMWQYGSPNFGASYKSIDGGVSFQQIIDKTGIISVGNNPDNISITDIFDPGTNNSRSGTWSTTNGGSTWARTGDTQNWFKGWAKSTSFIWAAGFNGLNKTLRKDRFNPDRLYGAFGQWAWSSIDGGTTLNNISTIDKGNDRFLSTGMENIEGNAIDVNDQNTDVVYMGAYDIGVWYSLDHGESWKYTIPDNSIYADYSWYAGGGSNTNIVLSDPARENVVWATFSKVQPDTESALFRSDQYGENWTMSNTGLDPFGLTMHGLSLDVNSPVTNRTLYITQAGSVFKSVDDGQSWFPVLQVGGLKFTAVDKINSQIVYAGGENGFWRSLDAGNTWTDVGLPEMSYVPSVPGAIMNFPDIVPTYNTPWNNPPLDQWQGIFDIQPDPNVEGRVYATGFGPNKGLYRSNDSGTTWTKLYTNDKMRGVAIAPNNSDIIYASSSLSYHSGGYDASSIGFIVSFDGGNTWDFANEGMGWTNGGRMKIESGPNPHLWAWSPGTGIQHTPIPCPVGQNCSGAPIVLEVCAFLEGTYNSNNGLMTTNLETLDLVPATQAYNQAPWNYSGTESRTITNIVDWVLVSFRTSPAKVDEVAQTAGLLKPDGCIHFPDDNVLPGEFNTPVHVVVEHRNHVGVMSPQPVSVANGMLSYDFRTADSYSTGGFGQKQLATGVWGMLAGDIDPTDAGSYDINGSDKAIWQIQNGLFNIYLVGDLNQDGDVTGADRILWNANNGAFSTVPK